MYVHENYFISYSRACLYITYDMIYVIHGNKIIFIVIVIVMIMMVPQLPIIKIYLLKLVLFK